MSNFINTLAAKAGLPVRQEGQAMVEYGLILALVSVAAFVGLTAVGTDLQALFTTIAGKI